MGLLERTDETAFRKHSRWYDFMYGCISDHFSSLFMVVRACILACVCARASSSTCVHVHLKLLGERGEKYLVLVIICNPFFQTIMRFKILV